MPSVQRGFETPCVAAPSGGSGAGTCSNRALLLAKAPAKAAAAPKGGRFSLDQNVLWHLLELISPSAESRSTSCLFCCKYSLCPQKGLNLQSTHLSLGSQGLNSLLLTRLLLFHIPCLPCGNLPDL